MSSSAELWSGASYERVAATFASIHEQVVRELALGGGDRVLDLGCGTGGVALVAARTGATVVGLDLSSDQLDKARLEAEEAGLEIRFDQGDCQEMPYADASFDAVASVFGFVFAADHRRAAAELVRVVQPGGRVALTAWPEDDWSRLGDRLGRSYPPGDDTRRWSDPGYVAELLGEAFQLRFERHPWAVTGSPQELWELVRSSVPPLRVWLEGLEAGRYAEAERAYLEFFAGGEMRREYLLSVGSRT